MTQYQDLVNLNLSSQQAKLYLAALEISPAGVAELSKKAGIERTASYPHLEELVARGLLNIVPKKGKRLYEAQSPERFGEILEEKKQVFGQVLPELMSIFNAQGVKPKIRYYEGREGMRTILTNSVSGVSKINYHLNPINNVMEVLGEEFSRRHVETRVKREIRIKTLRRKEAVTGPWEITSTDESLHREIRYLPDDFKLENLICIYGHTVGIISSTRENYGLEIESQEFADTMRSFFGIVWAMAGLAKRR